MNSLPISSETLSQKRFKKGQTVFCIVSPETEGPDWPEKSFFILETKISKVHRGKNGVTYDIEGPYRFKLWQIHETEEEVLSVKNKEQVRRGGGPAAHIFGGDVHTWNTEKNMMNPGWRNIGDIFEKVRSRKKELGI